MFFLVFIESPKRRLNEGSFCLFLGGIHNPNVLPFYITFFTMNVPSFSSLSHQPRATVGKLRTIDPFLLSSLVERPFAKKILKLAKEK